MDLQYDEWSKEFDGSKSKNHSVQGRHERLINHLGAKMVRLYLKNRRSNKWFPHSCMHASNEAKMQTKRWKMCTNRKLMCRLIWKHGKLNVICERALGALENICCRFDSISIPGTNPPLTIALFFGQNRLFAHEPTCKFNLHAPLSQRMWITGFLYDFVLSFFYVLEIRSVGLAWKKKEFIIDLAVHSNEICNRELKWTNRTYWLMSGHDSICRCHR